VVFITKVIFCLFLLFVELINDLLQLVIVYFDVKVDLLLCSVSMLLVVVVF